VVLLQNYFEMKQFFQKVILSSMTLLIALFTQAQCSICTKTASQLGEDAGRGLNAGILYLAAAPFLVVGYIGYRWWKNNKE
jgi:hypothetical protein